MLELAGLAALALGLSALGLPGAADGPEALLELVDPSLGVDELLLPREERVGVGGDPDRNDLVIHAVHLLDAIRLGGRAGEVLLPGRHVLQDDRVVFGVEIRFHEMRPPCAGGENA